MSTRTFKHDEFKDHVTETDGFSAQYLGVELLRLLVNAATVQVWLCMARRSFVDLYRSLMVTDASVKGVLGVSPSCHFAPPEYRVCGLFLLGRWILSVGLAFAARGQN